MADDQETSLKDDLLAAAEEVEGAEEVVDEVEVAAAPEATQEAEEEVYEEASTDTVAADDSEPTEPAEPTVAYKPPVDWPAEVKAKFGDADPAIQEAVVARERHINQTLEETAQVRREHQEFSQMIAPYGPLLQAEGVQNPMAAVKGLLDTTAQLMMGTPAQKAQRVAQLIQHYGVDIATLDQVLVGENPVDPQMSSIEQMINQRLAPVDQLLQRVHQTEQQSQYQAQEEAGQTIEQFAQDPKHVHFDSVRDTMADFLDMAAQRGQNMTIDEAYQRACLADPQIAPLVTQQFQQQAASANAGTIAGKRNAASSIHGNKAASGSATALEEGMGLREALEAQFADSRRI